MSTDEGERERTDADGLTRRKWLTAIGLGAAVGLAGCSADGDDGGGGTATPDASSPGTRAIDDVDGTSGEGGTSGGCPSPPSRYARRDVLAESEGDSPAISVELPEGSFAVAAESRGAVRMSLHDTVIAVVVNVSREGTIEAAATEFSDSPYSGLDVSDQFDLPAGARAISTAGYEAQDPFQGRVWLPLSSGFAEVELSLPGPDWCPDVMVAVNERIVNSLLAI